LAGLVVGVLTGMMVAYIGLPPFIVTLGTYTAIRGAAYLAAGGTTVINSKIGFAWIGNGYVGPGTVVGRNRSLNHRQIATLLAFVRIYESVARDDAVDLLHQLVGTKLLRAEHTGERERLHTLDDLDASALRLRETCLIVLDRSYTDSELRAAIFTRISREQLEKDVATIGALSREDHGNYYEHLCNHYGQVRRFLPRLLREIHFEGNRAGQSVLEALEFLKRFEDSPQVTIQDAPREVLSRGLAPVRGTAGWKPGPKVLYLLCSGAPARWLAQARYIPDAQ
jgi:hypothetical protein